MKDSKGHGSNARGAAGMSVPDKHTRARGLIAK